MSSFKSSYLPGEEKQNIWNNGLCSGKKNKSESIYFLTEVAVRETPDNTTTEIFEEGYWTSRTLLKNAEMFQWICHKET